MATAVVNSGNAHPLTVVTGITRSCGVGEATLAANTSVNTVTDAGVTANAQVMIFPTSATAGMLSRLTSVSVQSVAAGSFVINASATGGTPPDGTETYGYIFMTEG